MIVISGPCVIESEKMVMEIAEHLKTICEPLRHIELVFKASFDKANRTSKDSFRGIGFTKGLAALIKVQKELHLNITTDVHEVWQVPHVAEFAQVIQIPAFLCRQTDLLVAAAMTDKVVNIKKGQFMSAVDITYSYDKVEACNARLGWGSRIAGSNNIWITERGNCFGYNNLIVDFAGLSYLVDQGHTAIFDGTHCHQQPMKPSAVAEQGSSGSIKYVKQLCKAALAVGVKGIFLETHPNPREAKSDASTSIPLDEMNSLLTELKDFNEAIDSRYSS